MAGGVALVTANGLKEHAIPFTFGIDFPSPMAATALWTCAPLQLGPMLGHLDERCDEFCRAQRTLEIRVFGVFLRLVWSSLLSDSLSLPFSISLCLSISIPLSLSRPLSL